MKNNVNQSKRIYDKTTKQWYEIPEDQYREYDRWRTALRKRMENKKISDAYSNTFIFSALILIVTSVSGAFTDRKPKNSNFQ